MTDNDEAIYYQDGFADGLLGKSLLKWYPSDAPEERAAYERGYAAGQLETFGFKGKIYEPD